MEPSLVYDTAQSSNLPSSQIVSVVEYVQSEVSQNGNVFPGLSFLPESKNMETCTVGNDELDYGGDVNSYNGVAKDMEDLGSQAQPSVNPWEGSGNTLLPSIPDESTNKLPCPLHCKMFYINLSFFLVRNKWITATRCFQQGRGLKVVFI